MKRMLRLSLLACTGLLLLLNSSCTFQKRLYRPGFFVQTHANKTGREAIPENGQQQTTATTQTASVNKTTDVETLPVVRESSTSSAAKTTPAVQTTKQENKAVRKADRQSRKAIKRLVKKKTAAADKPTHQYIIGSCVCLALGIIGGVLLLTSIGTATTLSGAAGLLLLGIASIVIGVFGAFGLSAAGLIKLKMGDDANFGGYLLGFIMLGLSILLGTGIVFLFLD